MSELEIIIKKHIIQNDDAIGFDEFMQFALYHPQYGYYRNSLEKIGAQGDFITAPHISSLFGQTVTKQILQYLSGDSILEFGAGSGLLALQILQALEKEQALPKQYFILELSAVLKDRQQKTIQDNAPHLLDYCVWLATLPKDFDGVVIANEVLDAIPSKRFVFDKKWQELGVGIAYNQLNWVKIPSQIDLGFVADTGYQTEFNLMIKPWLKGLYDALNQAVVILIDYGYSEQDYYRPDRKTGTLRCYHRHKANDNPFIHLGEQDITTSVNFSLLKQSAQTIGFDYLGYSTQGHFLLNLGLLDLLESVDENDKIDQTQAIKQLILPNAMGELFKVMLLSKKQLSKPIGFLNNDMSYQL